MIDYAKVLIAYYKGAEWTLDGLDYSGLTWLSETDKPTKTVLDNLAAQMLVDEQAEAEAKAQAKAAAESKLAALGLTTDDLRALGL